MLKKLIDHIRHRRFCRLNGYYCPDCIYHDFIYEGAIFRGNRCRWGRKEEVEPTEEQVKEYCRKRGLVIVDSELFNEMKARWGEEPVRHGHWVRNDNGTYSCSECHSWIPDEQHYYARYCLFCGCKMNEEE